MPVLSVDLAHTSYANLGIILLEEHKSGFVAAPLTVDRLGLAGQPSPEVLAGCLAKTCERMKISTILLDGPQGWKHPDNGLIHCRRCEKALNTPAKTGLPNQAKPANYLPFVHFSIAVFQALFDRGFGLLGDSVSGRSVALESFPLAAWRSLSIRPLPAKKKCTAADRVRAADDLRGCSPSASQMKSPTMNSKLSLQHLPG